MGNIFTISLILLQSLGYFFIGANNSYSVLLPKELTLVKIDSLSDEFIIHTFLGVDESSKFEYSITISLLENGKDSLESHESIATYEIDCDCKVIGVEKVEFLHFEGTQYQIHKEREGLKIGGLVYFSNNTGEKSINVAGLALDEDLEKLKHKLEPILNTMVFNF